MKKRFLSLLMVLCLTLTLSPAVFAVENVGTPDPNGWDGQTTETIPSNGEITSAAQLKWLAEQVNVGEKYDGTTFTLMNDIDLNYQNFIPIGTASNPFAGILDGNGKTIKKANINGDNNQIWAGIFGCVSGEIHDLVLDSIVVNNSSAGSEDDEFGESSSGAMVGTLLDGGVIDDVTVLSTCCVTGKLRTGGVVGSVRGNGTTVSNCTNQATVNGEKYTGGIVGTAHDVSRTAAKSGAQILSCINSGAVTGTSEVGGIAGYTDRSFVQHCENSGTVTGNGDYGTGGIVGCDIFNYLIRISFLMPQSGSTIENCTNTGTVSAPRAGGILGSFVVAPSKDQPNSAIYSEIVNCTNDGTVSGTKCGAIYGAPISYKSGAVDTSINNMKVRITGCKVRGSVNQTSITTENLENYLSADSRYIVSSGNTLYIEVNQDA